MDRQLIPLTPRSWVEVEASRLESADSQGPTRGSRGTSSEQDSSRTPCAATPATPGTPSREGASGRVELVMDVEPVFCDDAASDADSCRDLPTTVQITNIPRKFTVQSVVDFLAAHGFELQPDRLIMVHVPCERRRATARGYAFVDAATEALGQEIVHALDGLQPPSFKRPLRATISSIQKGRQRFLGVSFPKGYEPRFASAID